MIACNSCLDVCHAANTLNNPRTMMTFSKDDTKPAPRVQRSPWMFSSSKFLTTRFSKKNTTSSSPTNDNKLPELPKESKSRHSEPVAKNKSPDYIPKLTKYRLENPDRFQKLSKSPQRSRKENSSSGGLFPREVSPMRASAYELGTPKWQNTSSREYGIQQAHSDSKNFHTSSNTSPKCANNKSANMNVTLLDIANLTPTAFDRTAPTQISDLLFNTFVDVQRFRRLLREDDALTTKNVEQRVNFCDAEKSRRIAMWLSEVDEEMKLNQMCEETIDENILYEDNSSKWNVKEKL